MDQDIHYYKTRFERLKRLISKITSSLEIGTILEIIRDEAKDIFPKAKEACLLVLDDDAIKYTRPLHCSIYRSRINCQLCKRGRAAIQKAIEDRSCVQCHDQEFRCGGCFKDAIQPGSEIALPILDGDRVLAVLDVISKKGSSFDEKEILLLWDLADLASNAIKNAKKYWQISKEKLTADKILGHLMNFVPQTVMKIVERNPDAPGFEKRQRDVTILFLDVGGYTRISETFSLEKVNFVIEKYFSSYLDIIYRYHGDINETAGDGLMIIFHERGRKKNALQAVHAALEIYHKTETINQELTGRFIPIKVNMGINSGKAYLGMTRLQGAAGMRMTYTASGPATNVAARIATLAKDGDILIGKETADRVDEELRLYDRGLHRLKNVAAPVQIYSLLRP